MTDKQLYMGYVTIGVLYVVVKIGFVTAGYLHPGAIIHGLLPAVLTVSAAILASKTDTASSQNRIGHQLMFILPVLVLITTPPYMRLQQGALWLANGRLPVLIIYECFALLQMAIAVRIANIQRQTSSNT